MLSPTIDHHPHNGYNPNSVEQTFVMMDAAWQSRHSAPNRMASCSSTNTRRFPLANFQKTAPYKSITITPWWSNPFLLVPFELCIGLVPRVPGAEAQAFHGLAVWRQACTFTLHVSGAANGTINNLTKTKKNCLEYKVTRASKQPRCSLYSCAAFAHLWT